MSLKFELCLHQHLEIENLKSVVEVKQGEDRDLITVELDGTDEQLTNLMVDRQEADLTIIRGQDRGWTVVLHPSCTREPNTPCAGGVVMIGAQVTIEGEFAPEAHARSISALDGLIKVTVTAPKGTVLMGYNFTHKPTADFGPVPIS